jgi:hypothetical protein
VRRPVEREVCTLIDPNPAGRNALVVVDARICAPENIVARAMGR